MVSSAHNTRQVAPLGVKCLKVSQPLGFIDDHAVPQKYTTKEGFAVAGPHIDPDEDDDAPDQDDAKFLKKMKYMEGNTDTPRSKKAGPRASMHP